MLTTLDHLIIAVRDLDAATRTYAALLGREPSWRGEHPGAGTANALFRLDRTYVELLAPVGDGAVAAALREHLQQGGEGPFAIAFGTDDADACAQALRARGLSATDPIDAAGREAHSGAERQWRMVILPRRQTRGVRLFAIEHRSPPRALPVVAPIQPEAAVLGVDHAVIMTADADAGCALYRDQLGLRLAFDRVFTGRALRLMFFRVGGVTVELAAPLATTPGHDRFWGISWRVANLDAVRVRLADAGFDVSAVRPGHKAGTRVCTVRHQTHGVATLMLEPAARG